VTSPWSEVADRIWIRRYASLDQTIGVIGGASGLVVIDTRATHRLADELRDELRLLPGELAAVVNTTAIGITPSATPLHADPDLGPRPMPRDGARAARRCAPA
jgi:hypothetical protein